MRSPCLLAINTIESVGKKLRKGTEQPNISWYSGKASSRRSCCCEIPVIICKNQNI